MEKFTIEEKAKRYDEALKRAKSLYSKGAPDSLYLEEMFPELKENEDEKIKESLINSVNDLNTEWLELHGVTKKNAIAWLEKVGGQRPANKPYTFKAIPRILEMVDISDRLKSYCQKLIESLMKEGYEEDAKIVEERIKQINGEDVAMATMDEKILNEPKPNGGIVMEDFNGGDGFYKMNLDYLSKAQIEYIENLINSWNNQSEPNQSWCDADDEMIYKLLDFFRWNGNTRFNKEECDTVLEWLKRLNHRLHWKPSNEQIEKAAQEWETRALFNPLYMVMEGDTPTGIKQDITTHSDSFKGGVEWLMNFKKINGYC